ncbi:zinc-binding dehydrogenase [Cercophora newfieldiana]|uniref:Zinc-binding dehydrogenase n=1 Tax=Cercophora newfieldiana TaxID=92897 RepID=A0AA40CQ33_9PEZI|nr:zinc-binding dehydrogenase [Cercophora newfieldiana]
MPYSLTVKKTEGKPGQVWYPLQLNEVPKPTPGPGQLLIKLSAAALNHRDLFIRQHLYPAISFSSPFLADGYGTVVESGPNTSPSLHGKPVLLLPHRGWDSDPSGPEDPRKYGIIGSSAGYDLGTAQEYVVVDEDEAVLAPEHLSPAEGAALPLVGVTAWRALVTKSGAAAREGANVLITGIGGGVALQALQFAVGMGCNVWVTSGTEEKIERAVGMGARGGVLYKEKDWERRLGGLLPRERPVLDAVIDGTGGEVVSKTVKLLKAGGVIVCYGMTLGPKMDWVVQAMLKNVELKGSTMGSKKEFKEMVEFVREKKIRPVVSKVVRGLDNLEGIEGLFEDMKGGKQFGKLVILIDRDVESPKL